jgi:hypothetical protein
MRGFVGRRRQASPLAPCSTRMHRVTLSEQASFTPPKCSACSGARTPRCAASSSWNTMMRRRSAPLTVFFEAQRNLYFFCRCWHPISSRSRSRSARRSRRMGNQLRHRHHLPLAFKVPPHLPLLPLSPAMEPAPALPKFLAQRHPRLHLLPPPPLLTSTPNSSSS